MDPSSNPLIRHYLDPPVAMAHQKITKRVRFSLPHETPSTPWMACIPLPSIPSPSSGYFSLPSTNGLTTPRPSQSTPRQIYSPSSKPPRQLCSTPRSSLVAMNPILLYLYFDLTYRPHITAYRHMLEAVTDPGVPRLTVVNRSRIYGWNCTVHAAKGSQVVTIYDLYRAMFHHARIAMTAAELQYHPKLQRASVKHPRRIDSLYGRTEMCFTAIEPGDDGLELRVEFF